MLHLSPINIIQILKYHKCYLNIVHEDLYSATFKSLWRADMFHTQILPLLFSHHHHCHHLIIVIGINRKQAGIIKRPPWGCLEMAHFQPIAFFLLYTVKAI